MTNQSSPELLFIYGSICYAGNMEREKIRHCNRNCYTLARWYDAETFQIKSRWQNYKRLQGHANITNYHLMLHLFQKSSKKIFFTSVLAYSVTWLCLLLRMLFKTHSQPPWSLLHTRLMAKHCLPCFVCNADTHYHIFHLLYHSFYFYSLTSVLQVTNIPLSYDWVASLLFP